MGHIFGLKGHVCYLKSSMSCGSFAFRFTETIDMGEISTLPILKGFLPVWFLTIDAQYFKRNIYIDLRGWQSWLDYHWCFILLKLLWGFFSSNTSDGVGTHEETPNSILYRQKAALGMLICFRVQPFSNICHLIWGFHSKCMIVRWACISYQHM